MDIKMNLFTRCVISCEDVSRVVRQLIYEPNELDAWDKLNSNSKKRELPSSSSSFNKPLVSEMSLACRLHMLAASFHDLRIELNKRVAIAKVFRNILLSDTGCDESNSNNEVLNERPSMHAGVLDGCFVVHRPDKSITYQSDGSSFRLPTLNWHDFRKGYTILAWVKPIISNDWNKDVCNYSEKLMENSITSTLFRFRSFSRRGKYIDASLSPFHIHFDEDTTNKTPMLQSNVEIISFDPTTHTSSNSNLPRVSGTITLLPGEWQLLAITHSFPYLKKPHITVSVNGNAMASGDLAYPSPDDTISSKSHGDLMEDCVLLENVVHASTKALESLRIAAINVYHGDIPIDVLACVGENGPNACWEGNILQPNPSIAPNKNTNRGLPKSSIVDYVGKISLAYHPSRVHSRYESNSANNAEDDRYSVKTTKQFCLNTAASAPKYGTLEGIRVAGLVKPREVPKTYTAKQGTDFMGLYGSIEVVIPRYLGKNGSPISCISLHQAWHTANGLEACLVPFSLSLAPHSSCFQHLRDFHVLANRYLHSLLSKKAEFCCLLLRLFATCLRLSPSFRDEVVQREILFMVNNLVRRILIRGRQISRSCDVNSYEIEDISNINGINIPDEIASAMVDIIHACCGAVNTTSTTCILNEGLGSSLSIRRTSDLAEQALHGIGLDLSLRNASLIQCIKLLYARNQFSLNLRQRFSRFIRMKLTVETFLGMVQLQFASSSVDLESNRKEDFIQKLSSLLVILLEASLSDANSIVAAEKDVAACVSVLSTNHLGSIPTGVVLLGLSFLVTRRTLPSSQEMLLEQRLARNLILVDFHVCVGPVILGRVLNKVQNVTNESRNESENDWQRQWSLVLSIFVWLTQLLRKEEGDKLSRSVGKWLIASADAGALDDVCLASTSESKEEGSLELDIDVCSIFGGPFLHEAEKPRRLRVALPMVPALVISLLRRIRKSVMNRNEELGQNEMKALTKLLATAAVATKSVAVTKQNAKSRNIFASNSENIEVDDFDWGEWSGISIMLKITSRLESLLRQDLQHNKDKNTVEPDDTSWIDVQDDAEPNTSNMHNVDLIRDIKACQDLALDSCAAVLVKTASTEGVDLWQSWSAVINALTADESFFSSVLKEANLNKEPLEAIQKIQSIYAEDIFSRLSCMVIHQTLGGTVLPPSMKEGSDGSAMNLCNVADGLIPLVNIVAEHHVLPRLARMNGNIVPQQTCKQLSVNQRQLLELIVYFLQRGREELGWCSFDEYRHSLLAVGHDKSVDKSMDDTSRILLPLLRPALSIVLEAYVSSIYDLTTATHNELLNELKLSLTAAMVGLHPLSTARDVGFEAISVLRRVESLACEKVDSTRREKCLELMSYVANEMRIRMKNDRQIRRDFLKSHFPDGGDRSRSSSYDTTDEVAHELVESFILGTDSPMVPIRPNNPEYFKTEGHSFEGKAGDELNAALEVILDKLFGSRTCNEMDTKPDEVHFMEVVSNLKEFLDDYEKDNALYHEDMRMLYMVDNSTSNSMNLLDHADAVAQFLEISSTSSNMKEDTRNSNSPEALQYRRLLRCATHTDALTTKFLTECLCNVCENRVSRHEKSLNDGGASGAYGRIATYPIPSMSLFDRSIPKHFFGSDGEIDGDIDENENVKQALSLIQNSSLTITDITKISSEGEDDNKLLKVMNESSEESIIGQPDLNDFEWDETGLAETSRNRSDTSSSMDSAPLSPNISLEGVSLNSSRYESTCCPADGSFASGGAGRIMARSENVLHVRAEGSRTGTLILTSTHVIIEYDSEFFDGELLSVEEEKQRKITNSEPCENPASNSDSEEILKRFQRLNASLRPRSLRWSLAEISHIYLRRYRLRDSSLELFFIPSAGNGIGLTSSVSSVFLDFGSGKEGNIKRDDMADAVMRLSPGRCKKQWPDKSSIFIQEAVQDAQNSWTNGKMSNFDYLLELNALAGRSFNDLCQYPICPWVLSDYTSDIIPNLLDRDNFRDLSVPVGALNSQRLAECLERFESFQDQTIPPFMYGSHYSTSAGVVLHFLVRLHPFAGLHRQLQSGHFDVADRLFASVARTFDMCTGTSAAEVKELTPEFFSNPDFLRNRNNFRLGTSQDGEVIGDVILPQWAKGSPEKFIEVMRCAMESDICSEMLPSWIDLIFGFKQKGQEAIKANNVFFYLTYYGSIDVASIEDEGLRSATELQIAHFGQCPMQLFRKPHPSKRKNCPYTGLYGTIHSSPLQRIYGTFEAVDTTVAGAYSQSDGTMIELQHRPEKPRLPFLNAPLCYWVNIPPPPPGPHAHLLCVRFIGHDRCLGVDAKGVFHVFRWSWKADPPKILASSAIDSTNDDDMTDENGGKIVQDEGCFLAQRELNSFRNIPRLSYCESEVNVVGLSYNLFSRMVLVLADANGKGAMSIQFVDPIKGIVRSEAVVTSAHSDKISAIATVPVTHAFGEGELAIVGSNDGTASVWRFVTSDFLPLRPKFRLKGHCEESIIGVALDASLSICVTISRTRCCLHSMSDGTLINTIKPPKNPGIPLPQHRTVFANTRAIALSKRGLLVLVCQSFPIDEGDTRKPIVTLQLFSLSGEQLGGRALDTWRGTPNNINIIADGTLAMVSAAGGITIHRLSSLSPLDFVDEWRIFDDPTDMENGVIFSSDIGPSRSSPVVAAAACSSGTLRLHALPGISKYSEDAKKSATIALVGGAFTKPAKSIKKAVGNVTGIGNRVVDFGKELGKEAISDVKDKGIGGFLGGVFDKAKSAVGGK